MDIILETKDLTKTYKAGNNHINAVDHTSICVERGDFVTIVGKSGSGKSTLLDKYLFAIDLDREKNCYIANIVKCRPPQNRDPLPAESEACMPWLREQFRLLRPKIVVCLGRIAAQRMIRSDFSVTKEHGQFIEKNGILFMGTFHPAALLRGPQNKPNAFADFVALRDKIHEVCEHTYE